MGRGRRAGWVAGAAMIAVAVLACRQLVGIGDGPPQGPAGTANDAGAEAGFTYGQRDCAACVTMNCAAEATACAATPSCAALEGCMSAANGDATMRAQCGVTWGLGNDGATPAFEACLATSCETQCGLTCGGLAAVFPSATATQCETCIVQGPCNAVRQCAQDPTCQAAVRCRFSAATADVQATCPSPEPDADLTTLVGNEQPPIAGSCATKCSWGADWTCAGNVTWPTPTSAPVDVTAYVYNDQTSAPIPSAVVKLCNTQDQDCIPVLYSNTTGDAGTAPLVRPGATAPLLFYLDVSSPAIDPILSFDVFPVTEPAFTFPVPVVLRGYLAAGAAAAGVFVDPSLGVVLVGAVDCRLAFASGVTLSIEPQTPSTQTVYFAGTVPDPTAVATDDTGIAVIVNVPVFTNLTLAVKPLALDGGVSGTMHLFARDSGASQVYAPPTPLP